MESIRRIGTTIICGILGLGFVLVLAIVIAYGFICKGKSNSCFAWLTQNASVDLNWTTVLNGEQNKYDKDKNIIKKYVEMVTGAEDTIEDFCTSAIPKITSIKEVADIYKNKILNNQMEAVVGGKTNQEYAEEAYNSIYKFANYLENKEIEFVYIQLPDDTRINAVSDNEEYSPNELNLPDRFAALMEKSNIKFINVDDYDEINIFSFDVSNHWMPTDALKSTQIIAGNLNNMFGYNFDLDIFEEKNYYNAMDLATDKNIVIEEEFGYSFCLPVPAFDTNYTVDNCETEIYEGDFVSTLLTPIDDWDRRVEDSIPIAYHNMWTIRNGAFVDIKNINSTNNEGKKILVLGDSFSWPVTSYLSEDVDEIAALHPRYFRYNVKKYIECYQPDIVIWIYQEKQIGVDNEVNFERAND